jgi:hypothetical protein
MIYCFDLYQFSLYFHKSEQTQESSESFLFENLNFFAPDVKHPLPLSLFGECFNKEGERQPKQTLK